MALSLTIEDGTNVAGSNSFATAAQINAYNAQRGVTLPTDPDQVIALATQAMDFIAAQEQRLQGKRTFGIMQGLSWPRTNVFAFGAIIPSNAIPADIIAIQCALVGIAAEGIDLYGNNDELAIIRDTIGPITTQFAPNYGASAGPVLPTIVAMLRPYCNGGAGPIRSVRI